MKSITILQPDNESLVAQLGSLYNAFKGISFGEKLEFDLSYLNWVFPILILPISAYINETQSEVKIDICAIKSYLEKISFPKGVNSISSFQRQIQKYKTYIPISVLSKKEMVDRERLESLFSEKIYETLGNVSGAQNAVCYPIAELITNIFEHSKKESGFIFGQFYPNKNYLDICIVDCGRGFAKTYKEEKELKLSDAEAITEAMKGNSVKKDKERGYGIRTSKEVICKALKGGGFILISGSSALVSTGQGEKLVALSGFYWQGTIIAYRIPKPTGSIDISPYIE
jgi:anti-sigma regulatory factor (Ser/Thr protein kinase)